jgi:hypothetical protein
MDEVFGILMFVIFILAPILEGLKRKKDGDVKPPRPPRPLPERRPAPPRQQPSRMEEVTTRPRADETAAGMVPDELWEMLTGQKRPAPSAPPPTAERERAWEVVYDPDDDEETDAYESDSWIEGQSLETLARHEEPVIISLEENLPSAAQRQAAFHEKIGRPVPVVERKHEVRFALGLHNRNELRKAMLLQVVLGKPKALE